jgi:hypothetical protein
MNIISHSRLLLVFAVLASPLTAVTPPPGFTALYNGRDLTGWRGGGTFDHRAWLAMPEAERAAKDAEWTAESAPHSSAKGLVGLGAASGGEAGNYKTVAGEWRAGEWRDRNSSAPHSSAKGLVGLGAASGGGRSDKRLAGE